ncbi:hypothetical protein NUW58_g1643 [Xylaria curta]|uniref:Uncharacterized protein n=1 Tax=Xylaria curta TaxID=42375 RepID=A0ACC1PJ74_9PEZI|nr:hypothetical protein NUW58_g1643 [Xylaria curta]
MAANLSNIAQAVGIQPKMPKGRESLAALVLRLEQVEYFQVFFMSFLTTYNWESHERNPAKVIKRMRPLYDSRSIQRQFEEVKTVGDCLLRWRSYISTEMDGLLPQYGETFLWFPETQPLRDAFGYVLFLFVYLRTGKAPEVVSGIYEDALSHLSSQVSLLEKSK